MTSSAAARRVPRMPISARTVLTVGAVPAVAAALEVVAPRSLPVGILLNGSVVGSLYALTAVGLILVYRANRIVNFAQAELGAVPALTAILLYTNRGLPYPVAVVLALLSAVGLGLVVERGIVRRFRKAPRLILTVATIGVAELLAYFELNTPRWVAGHAIPATEFHTPFTRFHLSLGGVIFTGDHLVALTVVAASTAALALFLRRTSVGIAIRAAAENADRCATLGIPTWLVSSVVWCLAAVLSTLAILLRAPIVGLQLGGVMGPSFLLFSLAAATVAQMDDMGRAFAAGLALGMIDQAVFYLTGNGDVSLALVLPVVLVGLLAQRRRSTRGTDSVSTWQSIREPTRTPSGVRLLPAYRAARLASLAAVSAALVILPIVAGPLRRNVISLFFLYAVIGVSLVVLSGWGGQISLGQLAFVGIGATVAGRLAVNVHADFFVSIAAAGIAGALVAVVIGLPALRLPGLLLPVVTLGLAATTQTWILNPRYFGWLLPDSASSIARPILWGRISTAGDLAYSYVCLVLLGLAAISAYAFRTSRSGRVLLGVRDNERTAASYAVSPPRTRLAAFAFSGFLAAAAGALYAYLQGAIDAGAFSVTGSLQVFAMVVIGGLGSLAGAVLGAAYVVGFQYFAPHYAVAASGVGMLVLLLNLPGGLAEAAYRMRDRVLARMTCEPATAITPTRDEARAPGGETRVETADPDGDDVLLRCRDVRAGYDGVEILFGVDLDVRKGETVALLGTNGAGKSTLLRAISGLMPIGGGLVEFNGADTIGVGAVELATRGIAQVPGGKAVFPSLTVAEHLRLAGWRHHDHGSPTSRERVQRALSRFPNLGTRLEQHAGDLSGGEQQALALAMAVVAEPTLLLIDELSLGLAPGVVQHLLEMLRNLQEEGCTIVIVEQSVNVALTIAQRAYFLEKGQVRYRGPTAELLDRPDLLRSVFLERDTTPAVAVGKEADDASGGTPDGDIRLRTADLKVSFGGIRAVAGVSIELRAGEVLGLIGPNGAGKTTLFDLVSGFIRPTSGRILLGSVDVTDWTPTRRASAGLGRAFQDARVFPSLTVAENLALSFERHLACRDPLADALALPASRAAEETVAWAVSDLIDQMGLSGLRDRRAAELSTGSRRVLELAMVMAHDPQVLLLDEPSSGLAQGEVESLGSLMRSIAADTGCSLLVIEHDMALIGSVSDEIVALELGVVIARGPAAHVLSDDLVLASYLGSDPAAINRSRTTRGRTPRTRRPVEAAR